MLDACALRSAQETTAGRVGSGQGQVRVESGQVRVESGRSIYMLCFFRSLIDFDWIEGHLISGRVRIGSGQFDFLKKSDRVGFESGRVGRVSGVGSGSATSTGNNV
jgi:hypothetical protein